MSSPLQWTAHHEDPDDLLQRVALKIIEDDLYKPDCNVLRLAERIIKGWYSNKKKGGERKYMQNLVGEQQPDDAPSSKPDPEVANVGKEREDLKSEVFDEVDRELPKGFIGDRARQILAQLRLGIDDTSELCEILGVDEPKIFKARMLLAETIERVLKRRGITIEALRSEP